MRLKDLKIGSKYRINYKITKIRAFLLEKGLLPNPGTVVIVTHIRDSKYSQPVTIIGNGKPYHCTSGDLIKYRKIK